MSLALKNAIITRNPVTLVLPNEVQEMENLEGEAGSPDGRIAAMDVAPPQSVLNEAVTKIKEAKRPILVIGHGARFDMESIIRFAEKLDIPVLTTFKAKGLISDKHPLGCGVLGRSGTPIASWFMNECDRIIAVGASFSNHTGIASYYPIIQIDFDPMALGKFHAVEIPVLGEIGRTFEMLHDAFPEKIERPDMREEVAGRWKIWRDEKESRVNDDSGKGINAAAVFAAMTRQAQEDSIIAVDVGNNTYSFGRYFETSGNQAVLISRLYRFWLFCLNGGLGCNPRRRSTFQRSTGLGSEWRRRFWPVSRRGVNSSEV
jgi:pyruvate oxidase